MISEIARQYAIKCHQDTNHRYDGYLPYEFHLRMVVADAHMFRHLVDEKDFDTVVAGCWLHDSIEDARVTFNDVKSVTNASVAELVYALTNEKGRSRKERANDKYYDGIRNTPNATFIKLCDRIANIQYGQMAYHQSGKKLLDKYKQEYAGFREKLYHPKYADMFSYMERLFNDELLETLKK